MAKVKILNLNKVVSSIRQKVTKELRSKEVREAVGDITVRVIKDTVIGEASSSTIKTRKYLEKGNTTDPKYNRSSIKALFTGELLEDLRNNVRLDLSEGVKYILEQSNKKHKKYKKPNGKPIKGKQSTHKQIQEYLEDMGYKYINNDKNNEVITSKIKKFIEDYLFKRLK